LARYTGSESVYLYYTDRATFDGGVVGFADSYSFRVYQSQDATIRDVRVHNGSYNGIYGNTVILDHGQGVFSLYAHLSEIKTALEEIVEKNTVIGKSGTTGMAGGDHLHFSMLIGGVFVNPLEWWDKGWLDLNITGALR